MADLKRYIGRSAPLAALVLSGVAALAQQGQVQTPPIPGPYQVAPEPVPQLVQPALPQAHDGMRVPYWMQQPGTGLGVGVSARAQGQVQAGGQTTAQQGQFPQPPAQNPYYGRVQNPGYFPGYPAPGRPMPAPPQGNVRTAQPYGYGGYAAQPYAAQPYPAQPYPAQPYPAQPYGAPTGYGWGPNPGNGSDTGWGVPGWMPNPFSFGN